MTGYDLSRSWFNFRFENPSKVRSVHTELYLYLVDQWNRLGQKTEIGLPTKFTMDCLGIGSYNTFKNTLSDLVRWGFVKVVKDSVNQHSAKIVALSKNDKASDKALDKATTKATDTIDKQRTTNKEQVGQPDNGPSEGVVKIIALMNELAGTSYKPETKESARLIGARLKQYAVEDLESVVKFQSKWLHDTKMKPYFRPTTLFAESKFESYLNQAKQQGYSNLLPQKKHIEVRAILPIDQQREQFLYMANTLGFRNCDRKELQWAYDFQHPYGILAQGYGPNETLTDRGLPGTLSDPNTLQEVMANG